MRELTLIEELKKGEIDPECVCCPTRDLCTVEPGVTITITKDVRRRSGCNGGFEDAFDAVDAP